MITSSPQLDINPEFIRAIVRRLTNAQRRALITNTCRLGTVNNLRDQGLCEAIKLNDQKGLNTERYRLIWSPLGAAVKMHLTTIE